MHYVVLLSAQLCMILVGDDSQMREAIGGSALHHDFKRRQKESGRLGET
jgi:hypothetical protein